MSIAPRAVSTPGGLSTPKRSPRSRPRRIQSSHSGSFTSGSGRVAQARNESCGRVLAITARTRDARRYAAHSPRCSISRAVGDPSPLRKAWDNWDVTTATGIKVEVKSSAYLQSWNQRKLSAITFSGLTGREWSAETNELAADRTLRAEVYVFAVHTCSEPDQYDPLKIEDWEFRVMSAAQLAEHGYRSVTLGFLDRHARTAYRLSDLTRAVEQAYASSKEADQ
jgi:hypothetical protein